MGLIEITDTECQIAEVMRRGIGDNWLQMLKINGLIFEEGRIGNYTFVGQWKQAPLYWSLTCTVPLRVWLERYFSDPNLKSIKVVVITFHSTIFGWCYAGSKSWWKTLKGSRTKPEEQANSILKGLWHLLCLGTYYFVSRFPRTPSSDRYLTKKPTIYWIRLAADSGWSLSSASQKSRMDQALRIQGGGSEGLDGEVIL